MGTVFTIIGFAAPFMAVVVGYLFGPRKWSLSFRIAGRAMRASVSGYEMAAVILAFGLALGIAFSPPVSTICGLRSGKPGLRKSEE